MDALLLSDYRQFFCPEQGQGPRNHFTVFTSYFSIIIKSPLSTVYEESLITYHNNRQEMKLARIRFQVVGGSKSPAGAEFHNCTMQHGINQPIYSASAPRWGVSPGERKQLSLSCTVAYSARQIILRSVYTLMYISAYKENLILLIYLLFKMVSRSTNSMRLF